MSDEIINPNVTTTVVMSLNAIVKYMQSVLPGVSFVYDDNLGYETGMTEMRTGNNLRDDFKNRLPAFFFKRSVLRYNDQGQSRRSVTDTTVAPNPADPNSRYLYYTANGMYDLEFNYVTTRMSELENFEVSWLSEAGIPKIKQVSVDVPNLGALPYYLTYNPLDDKVIQSSGNYYKVLTGTLQVRGWFLAFNPEASENANIIKEINTNVQTFSGEVPANGTETETLGGIQIIPTPASSPEDCNSTGITKIIT